MKKEEILCKVCMKNKANRSGCYKGVCGYDCYVADKKTERTINEYL